MNSKVIALLFLLTVFFGKYDILLGQTEQAAQMTDPAKTTDYYEPEVSKEQHSEILFVLIEETSIYNTFQLVQDMEIDIKELHGYWYALNGGEEMIADYKEKLKAKDYLWSYSDLHDSEIGPEFKYEENQLYMSVTFYNLNAEDATDWLNYANSQGFKSSYANSFPYVWGISRTSDDNLDKAIGILQAHPLVSKVKKNYQ